MKWKITIEQVDDDDRQIRGVCERSGDAEDIEPADLIYPLANAIEWAVDPWARGYFLATLSRELASPPRQPSK